MAELQRDPITRSDFLGFGILGTIAGAILTIPPAAFVLGPVIKTDVLGQSNVSDRWYEVAHISEVTTKEPAVFNVDFEFTQSYGDKEIQELSGVSDAKWSVLNAIWVSWHSSDGYASGSEPPHFVSGLKKGDSITAEQAHEAQEKLNVLSNSCAHLGCPVRWLLTEGEGEFLCPCHGGIYDINGDYVGGPPPRGMYSYTFEVREDGYIYAKHEFDVGNGLNEQEPYVI